MRKSGPLCSQDQSGGGHPERKIILLMDPTWRLIKSPTTRWRWRSTKSHLIPKRCRNGPFWPCHRNNTHLPCCAVSTTIMFGVWPSCGVWIRAAAKKCLLSELLDVANSVCCCHRRAKNPCRASRERSWSPLPRKQVCTIRGSIAGNLLDNLKNGSAQLASGRLLARGTSWWVTKAARRGLPVPSENLERYRLDEHGHRERLICGTPTSRAKIATGCSKLPADKHRKRIRSQRHGSFP